MPFWIEVCVKVARQGIDQFLIQVGLNLPNIKLSSKRQLRVIIDIVREFEV
jgi:hypothetical protein